MDRHCKQILKFAALVALGGVAAWFGCVFDIVHAAELKAALSLLAMGLWLEALHVAGRMPGDEKENGDAK